MPDTDTNPPTRDGEQKTRQLPTGETVHEADDCRFPVSPAGTVHERDEFDGDAHDYEYHPKCGQRLPPASMWAGLSVDSVAEIVEKHYDLRFCSKCFDRAYQLNREARAKR